MSSLFEKINLTLQAYCHSYRAMKRQFCSKEITEMQNRKLRNLIAYSYSNIKYYREVFDKHGIKPDNIKTITDITLIPILTKKELRERFWDFLPGQLPHCRVSRTSGSTGVPVCILSDNSSRLHNSAAVIRYRKALGLGFIGRPILTPLKTEIEPRKKPHWSFLQGIHKTYYINPYSNQDSEIKYAVEIMKALKKPALIGITPAIRALAWRIRDGILPVVEPCAVLTAGEYLSCQVRGLLEDTFRVKVADIYACTEAGDIAWQCIKGQLYHINADNCIVEILKDGKPTEEGQTGEVVITNLNRYSMPFIRYKNGDMASFAVNDCSCGCKLAALSQIAGRTGEDICLPGGKVIPWNQLKGFMNHPDIRQFQLVQNENGSLTVKFIPEEKSDVERIKKILISRFEGLLGNSIVIEFSIVERIAPASGGKSKLVVCHYAPVN